MITKISGNLIHLGESDATLDIPPFEYQVLIPDFTRRYLQPHVGDSISLFTIHYFEGNPAQGGKMTPRLVGFASEVEREFFELFCSVDGVGVKKALRAMVRPVQDVAKAIEQQDIKTMSTLPGIGAATAERIIAKLRRKMPKFALMVPSATGESADVERSVVDETYQVLCSLGHSEADARSLIEQALSAKKSYKDVESMINAIYEQSQ